MNALYDKGRQGFLDGSINWIGDVIKLALIDTNDYTVNLASDTFLSDIPATARVAISEPFTAKTATDGVADAADVTLPTVSGDECEAIVIFQDTGDPATSRLIAYLDTATALPIQPNGGDITVQWSDGPDKVFKL